MAVAVQKLAKVRENPPATQPRHRITPGPRLFTVAEYEALHQIGIIAEDERVELVQGEILEMAAIGFRHGETVSFCTDVLGPQIGPNRSWAGNPIRVGDESLPQPDYAVVRPRRYAHRHPTAEDILFVVEVSDSSQRFDLTVKLPLYAASGIPEAWIFDLTEDRIQRHTDPSPTGYRQIASVGRGESLASIALPSVTIVVDDVLGPPADEPDATVTKPAPG